MAISPLFYYMLGSVYLLRTFSDADVYKIGITSKPINKRIKELQTGNFNEIFLISCYESINYKEIERLFHKKYYSERKSGEWFNLSIDEVNSFISNAEKFNDVLTYMQENNYFYQKK